MRSGTTLHRERAFISVHRNNDGSPGWTWEVWRATYRGRNRIVGRSEFAIGDLVARGASRINRLAWIQAKLHADRVCP